MLIILFTLQGLLSQDPRTANIPSSARSGNGGNETPETPKEKAFVNYYTLDDLNDVQPFSDTTLNGFEIFAPHRTFENGALNLGNLGSSAYEIRYRERDHIFTELGFNQYNIYRLELEDFPFYDLNRPHNDLYFSPQSGQENFMVKAKFSRNFADNVNFSLDYERIKQEGFYTNQGTKMTRFGFGISRKTDKHELYINFIANNMNESFNGGISENIDSLDATSPIYRDQRTSLDSYITDADGRHQYFSYSILNRWNKSRLPFALEHLMRLEHGYFRFSDEDTDSSNDSLIYKSYLSNDRGLRMLNKFVRFRNAIHTEFDLGILRLKAGLDYRYLKFDDSQNTNNIHDLSLTGDVLLDISNAIKLRGDVAIGVGENAGNLALNARADFDVGQHFGLYAGLNSIRYDAALREASLVVTDNYIYQNDFGKIESLVLNAGFRMKKLNLELKATTGLINNAIAYNQDALPYQLSEGLEYFQFTVKHQLRWLFLGLDNEIMYQSFSSNVYNLPDIYSRHNLFLQTRLFKKRLLTRLGVQLYNIRYQGALAFMPVNGVFYPTSEEMPYYPISEMYINCQVDKFRIFFRFENFSDMLQPEVHYQIRDYPQFDARFRMGVRWIFSD